MKCFKQLKGYAVSALAIGCICGYGYVEGTEAPLPTRGPLLHTALAKNFEQKLVCKLNAKVTVDFMGEQEEIKLFNEQNEPQSKAIPFKVEGIFDAKLKVEFVEDGDTFQMQNGVVTITKLSDNTVVGDNGVKFKLSVVNDGGDPFDEVFTPEKTIELANDTTNYKIVIAPEDIKENTILGEYHSGTLKFSITGN